MRGSARSSHLEDSRIKQNKEKYSAHHINHICNSQRLLSNNNRGDAYLSVCIIVTVNRNQASLTSVLFLLYSASRCGFRQKLSRDNHLQSQSRFTRQYEQRKRFSAILYAHSSVVPPSQLKFVAFSGKAGRVPPFQVWCSTFSDHITNIYKKHVYL